MTDTSGKHNELIAPDAEDAYQNLNYAGCGDEIDIMFGPECEFFICKIDGTDLLPLDIGEAQQFKDRFEKATGTLLHQEAIASHFELNEGPMNLATFRDKFPPYFAAVHNLYRAADEQGYRVIPSSHAPHIKGVADVLSQLVDRRRIKLLIAAGRRYMGDELVKFANRTAGIHVSSGYRDTQQFYDDLRRTYYLSPFIYALSNNGFPFWKGRESAHGANPRLAVIEKFAHQPKGRTGIDPLFFTAADGEDFLKSYIDRMMNSPLLAYYRKELTPEEIAQGLTEPPLHPIDELGATPENPITFAGLEPLGLNTVANLQFSASSWWYGAKVQDIPGLEGKNGEPLKRLENRIWNAGTWQLATALLTQALLTEDTDCGREVDHLLSDYGFRPEGPAIHPQSAENLRMATHQAAHHGSARGLDFVYGNGTALEFGRDFTAILKKYAARHGLEAYLEAMDYIVQTNNTDARVLAAICETPEDMTAFIENYDVDSLADPTLCFGQLCDQGKLPDPAAQRHRNHNDDAENTAVQVYHAPEP